MYADRHKHAVPSSKEMEKAMHDTDAGIAIPIGADRLRARTDIGEAVLEDLYDRHAGALYRYALSILGLPEDAEDAVQEVFVRIAREIPRLKKVRNLKAYLFTAARNSAYSRLRERRRRERDFEAACLGFESPEHGGCPSESDALMRAFAELPVEQREVLTLHVYEQMTFEEIARMMVSSKNTITSRYRYAIAKLRKAVEAEYGSM